MTPQISKATKRRAPKMAGIGRIPRIRIFSRGNIRLKRRITPETAPDAPSAGIVGLFRI